MALREPVPPGCLPDIWQAMQERKKGKTSPSVRDVVEHTKALQVVDVGSADVLLKDLFLASIRLVESVGEFTSGNSYQMFYDSIFPRVYFTLGKGGLGPRTEVEVTLSGDGTEVDNVTETSPGQVNPYYCDPDFMVPLAKEAVKPDPVCTSLAIGGDTDGKADMSWNLQGGYSSANSTLCTNIQQAATPSSYVGELQFEIKNPEIFKACFSEWVALQTQYPNSGIRFEIDTSTGTDRIKTSLVGTLVPPGTTHEWILGARYITHSGTYVVTDFYCNFGDFLPILDYPPELIDTYRFILQTPDPVTGEHRIHIALTHGPYQPGFGQTILTGFAP